MGWSTLSALIFPIIAVTVLFSKIDDDYKFLLILLCVSASMFILI